MMRFKFTNPEKNDIVILHSNGHWIKEFILRDMASTTLEVYPKTFFVTPALFLQTIFRLCFIDWVDIARNWSYKYLRGKIYQTYILACIEKTQAKVVITFIDNSVFAQKLSRIDHKRTYFFIQNGTRTLACVRNTLPLPPHPAAIISMTNFFCFGQREIDLYVRQGHIIDNYFPIGSLGAGCYKKQAVSNLTPNFDICLISQWEADFFQEAIKDTSPARQQSRIGPGLKGVNSFLSRFIAETGLSLVICPRHEHDDVEISYLKREFGENALISSFGYKQFAAYRMMDQSRLVIALNSTLLSEAFSWGKKVLWCNVTEDEHFEMPEAGISYFHGGDYAAFKERMLMLLKMPQDEYEMATREKARYICNYNPANPPQEIVRSAIIKVLSNLKSAP